MNEIYGFFYTPCIYESAPNLESLHRTKIGAYMAMRRFIIEGYNYWYDNRILVGRQRFKFGQDERWFVSKRELEN